jgi:hypothetical protein
MNRLDPKATQDQHGFAAGTGRGCLQGNLVQLHDMAGAGGLGEIPGLKRRAEPFSPAGHKTQNLPNVLHWQEVSFCEEHSRPD